MPGLRSGSMLRLRTPLAWVRARSTALWRAEILDSSRGGAVAFGEQARGARRLRSSAPKTIRSWRGWPRLVPVLPLNTFPFVTFDLEARGAVWRGCAATESRLEDRDARTLRAASPLVPTPARDSGKTGVEKVSTRHAKCVRTSDFPAKGETC
jgi:hypothetical protein